MSTLLTLVKSSPKSNILALIKNRIMFPWYSSTWKCKYLRHSFVSSGIILKVISLKNSLHMLVISRDKSEPITKLSCWHMPETNLKCIVSIRNLSISIRLSNRILTFSPEDRSLVDFQPQIKPNLWKLWSKHTQRSFVLGWNE